jgi:hypothetical protein
MKKYLEFLKTKMSISHQTGFDIDRSELCDTLYPHVKDSAFEKVKKL